MIDKTAIISTEDNLPILSEEMVQVAGGIIEGPGLDAEVLQHRGEKVVQGRLTTVEALPGIVVTFVLQSAAREDDRQVTVGVSGGIADAAAEEYHGIVEE